MCEPMMLLAGLGAGISALGQIQQGQAASDAAKYQAQVDRNNAISAHYAARDSAERGQAEEQAQRRKTADAMGRARASFAARGIESNFGSPLDVMGDISQYGELDALTIRGNADREYLKYDQQRQNFNSSASFNDMKAANAKTAGFLGAAGSLLSGGQTVAGHWYKMK